MSLIDQDKNQVSVTQDNQLIEASYTLTLNEKRLLLLGMSQLDPTEFPKQSEPAQFEITADQWAKHFPDDTKPWRALKRATDELMTRTVTLHPKSGHTKKIAWFDSAEYIAQEGRVKVQFGWSINVRLQGMLEKFTKINLLAIGKLGSFHSIRLYELVSQFRSTGYRRISIENFRLAMNCLDLYPRIGDMKTRVLNPALKEINEKSDFSIECRDIKRGRKITGFEFIISEKEQRDLFK